MDPTNDATTDEADHEHEYEYLVEQSWNDPDGTNHEAYRCLTCGATTITEIR